MANDQQDMSSGKGFTLSAVRSPGDILHSFMLQAGINPTPKPGDKAGVEQVGKIWSAYEQRVAAWESINGKKAGTAELEKIGAELFTRVPVAGVLFGTNEKPAVLVDQAKDKVVVPEVDRQLILAAFAKERPGEVPSDETVRALYLRGLGL